MESVAEEKQVMATTSAWSEKNRFYRLRVVKEKEREILYVQSLFKGENQFDGLPSGWRWEDIKEYFQRGGRVLTIDGGTDWKIKVPEIIINRLLKQQG